MLHHSRCRDSQPPAQGRLNSNAFIGEFRGIPISPHLLYQLIDVRHMENGFTWMLLLALVLVGLFLWKRQLGPAVIAFVALYFGLAHARYMAMFAITIATLGGPLLSEIFVINSKSASTGEAGKTSRPLFRIPDTVAIDCHRRILRRRAAAYCRLCFEPHLRGFQLRLEVWRGTIVLVSSPRCGVHPARTVAGKHFRGVCARWLCGLGSRPAVS